MCLRIGDHTKDEWLSISSLRTVVSVYQDILRLHHVSANNYRILWTQHIDQKIDQYND